MVEAYKRNKTIQPRFKPHGAIPLRPADHVAARDRGGQPVDPLGAYQRERMGHTRGQADLVYGTGSGEPPGSATLSAEEAAAAGDGMHHRPLIVNSVALLVC